MSTTINDDELTPAGLRRNRLTLCYREGQNGGLYFQNLLHDPDPRLDSGEWAKLLKERREPPRRYLGEDRAAWEAGFHNGRTAARGSGELAPSPYLDTPGAKK